MFACLHAPGNAPLLVECAENFSPWIEETSPDTVIFDIRGLNLIFGSWDQIAGEIERQVGLPANIAIASNPDAASHAARGIEGVTVIPPNQEAAALAKLPLFILGGSPESAATMDAWGIRTFGDLARIPPIGLSARLGDEGLRMQRLARGEESRLLMLRTEPVQFRDEMEPETPIELLEPLLFVLFQMLNALCKRLKERSWATNELYLRLNQSHEVVLRLPVPMLDPKVLLKLLHLDLSSRSPKEAIERIYLKLTPVLPRTTQHGLFLQSSPEPEKLEITLARIRNLVGAQNVGAPELTDTHRPDSFRIGPLCLTKD